MITDNGVSRMRYKLHSNSQGLRQVKLLALFIAFIFTATQANMLFYSRYIGAIKLKVGFVVEHAVTFIKRQLLFCAPIFRIYLPVYARAFIQFRIFCFIQFAQMLVGVLVIAVVLFN